MGDVRGPGADGGRRRGALTVLVCDEQPVVRTGLVAVLTSKPDIAVVGEAATASDAVTSNDSLRPDVVLVAATLPPGGGVSATRRLVATSEAGRPAVLVLGTSADDALVVDVVASGAAGFVRKDGSPRAIVDAIRSLGDGGAVISPSATRALVGWLQSRLPAAPSAPTVVDRLSRREQEVLRLVAAGASSREVSRDLGISQATVRSHVHHILTKLHARDRAHAVSVAYRRGLLH